MNIRLAVVGITVAAILSACSNTESTDLSNSGETSSQGLPVLQDDSNSLVSLINTGDNNQSLTTHWNCSSTAEDGTQTDNIHVRFWLNGTGFSGNTETQWLALSETDLSVNYAEGSFQLNNIAFSTLETEADYFSANDSTGSQVSCTRHGPSRNDNQQILLSDGEDLQNPLLEMLTTPNPSIWNCSVIEDGATIRSKQMELYADGSATVDSESARWFVDSQYNVIISTQSEMNVIRDIESTDDNNSFSASMNQFDLSCERLPV